MKVSHVKQTAVSIVSEEYWVLGTRPGENCYVRDNRTLTEELGLAKKFGSERAALEFLHLGCPKEVATRMKVIRVLNTVRESSKG